MNDTTMPTSALETITPSVAKRYLTANRANRPLGKGAIADYVSAMKAGDWMVNGESIKFDRNGQLVDGQHRLEAIVRAGKPILSFVTRGLDPEVFKTLDTGKKRSASDVFAIRGIQYSTAVSAAARLLHRTLANEFAMKRRVSNTVLDDLLRQHPRFVEICIETQRTPYASELLIAAHQMFAFYMASHVDARRARSFFRTLAGRPEPGERVEFQAVRLRERLTKTLDEIVKPAPKVRLAWIIEAWNCAIQGKTVDRFSRLITELPDWDPEPRFVLAPAQREAAG